MVLPEWLPRPEVTCLAWPRYRPFSGEVPSRLLELLTDLGRFVEAPCPDIGNENKILSRKCEIGRPLYQTSVLDVVL